MEDGQCDSTSVSIMCYFCQVFFYAANTESLFDTVEKKWTQPWCLVL